MSSSGMHCWSLSVFKCYLLVYKTNSVCELPLFPVLLCDKLNCTTSATLIKLVINAELVTIQLVGLITMTSL